MEEECRRVIPFANAARSPLIVDAYGNEHTRSGSNRIFNTVVDFEFNESDRVGCHCASDAGRRDCDDLISSVLRRSSHVETIPGVWCRPVRHVFEDVADLAGCLEGDG